MTKVKDSEMRRRERAMIERDDEEYEADEEPEDEEYDDDEDELDAPLTRHHLRPKESKHRVGRWLLGLGALGIAAAIIASLPDFRRYQRIRSM